MAGDINRVTLVGRLTRDPELRHLPSGSPVLQLGLAVNGTPGRLLYAFETSADSGRQKAVLCVPLGADAKHIIYRLPADLGEPKGALWSSETTGGIVVDRGVLWFSDEDDRVFLPMALTQPTALGQYFGDDRYFWYVVPHTAMAAKSILVPLSVPFDEFALYLENYPKQPLRVLRIDGTGLAR